MSISNRLAGAITLALAVAPPTLLATELDYTLYSGIEHSDNINLAANQPISQNVFIPGFNFTLQQQGATLQANVAGDLQYRDYLGNRFTSQTQTQLAGQANWTVLPDRLDLTAQDYAGVQPVDALVSNGPANLQQTNVFTLGPTLHFRLGETLLGQAELRYINSYAQKTPGFNSQRGEAALRIVKNISATDQLSANAETRRTTFVNAQGGPNYSRTELFGRYVSKLKQLDIDAALGWSRLKFDGAAARTVSSPLARLMVGWRMTERSALTLSASRQYSDAAESLMQPPGQGAIVNPGGISGGTNTGNAVINSQIYLERRLGLTYSFRSQRLLFTAAPDYYKFTYANDPTFNQTARGGSLGLDYNLRPTLTLSTYVRAERLSYQTLARRDRSLGYDLSLIRQVNEHWSWRVAFGHQQRSSSAPNQGFQENRIYFGVAYKR